MGKKCIKCGYERQPTDTTPEYECPQCGAVYAKTEAALAGDKRAAREKTRRKPPQPARTETSAGNKSRFLLHRNPLTSCKDCGKEVSRKAKTCPHCGAPVASRRRGCLMIVLILAVFFTIVFTGAYRTFDSEVKRQTAQTTDAECMKSLTCWGNRYLTTASAYCQGPIERTAQYTYEWTDSWGEPKFTSFRWNRHSDGTLVFSGDKIRFQNAFGAWQNQFYHCFFDPKTKKVLEVRVRPGYLSDHFR